MSSGKAHARASLLLTATGLPIAVWTLDPLAGLAHAAGCASGIPLTPDLDQEGISKVEWALVRKTGGAGFLWLAYWWTYARAIPHRSFWSHFPVVGTAIRVLYAFWWTVPLSFAIRWRPGPLFWWYAGWWFAGLCLSDLTHFVMDKLVSKAKKRKGKQR